ncbi:MAG: hypothetical protein O3C10_03700 [Chloroflexi bacterium]|nr:hypothetical protein [Chloroflexota bacterium]
MPTISFTVSATNVTLLREALAHHQGRDVADVTAADVKDFAGRQLRAIVQKYRQARRDGANPVETSDPLT